MSYILDALKKSESERRAGSAPGLAAGASYMVAPQSRSRHTGTLVVLGLGLLATGLALGSWRSWQAGPAPTVPPAAATLGTSAAPLATTMPTPVVSAALPAADKRGPAVLATVAPAAERKVSLENKPAADKKAPAVSAKRKAPHEAHAAPSAAVTTAPAPVAVTSPPVVPATTVAAVAPGGAMAARREAVRGGGVATASAARPTAVAAPVVAAAPLPAPAAVPAVVAYRDLPPNVQGTLPTIVFGGFAGGNEGEAKMAFINSRLVREGEELSPGLKLEAVSQDGAVLAYQGYRFRANN